MNNDIAINSPSARALAEYDPSADGTVRGHRLYSAVNILDLASLIRIAQHWRWLILGAIALGLAGGVITTLLTKPLYRAWVTLEANPPVVEVSDEQTRERASSSVSSYDFVATQVGLLSSLSVAERTAEDLNLANNPDFGGKGGTASQRLGRATGIVAGGLKVIPPEQGQLIRYSYVSGSPQMAATVANAVADSFINSGLQRRYEASAYARRFLERQIAKTRGDLERSERQLVAYAQAEGIINTGGTDASGKSTGDVGSLQGESLMSFNKALADATARRVAAEGAYRAALAAGPTEEVNAGTSALRQQKAALESDYQQKRTLMKPDHPDMLSLRSQIDELSRQISKETAQVTSGRSNSLAADYRSALSSEQALQSRVGQLKGSVLDLRGRSIQYNILQRETDTNRSLYDALLQRYKEIGVAGGIGTAPVSIVDRADPPGGPFKPNLLMNLLVGIGLGALAGLGAAVGLELLNDTIKTREDVRQKLGLACLGAIPRTGQKQTLTEELIDPSSAVSEAYSAIVASLRFSTEGGMPKTLMLSSSGAREGKSTSALALAQNFARMGTRVLLIDADLRKPAFRSSNDKVGLTKLLTSADPLRSHVVETQHDNLWLLPSGPIPPNPADLLAANRFRVILAEASAVFDIVIIDAPPTLGLADAPLLAAAVGNVMFVAESGVTRTRAAIEALNRLEVTGARVLGVALTKASDFNSYQYSQYGYGRTSLSRSRTQILMIPGAAPAEPPEAAEAAE